MSRVARVLKSDPEHEAAHQRVRSLMRRAEGHRDWTERFALRGARFSLREAWYERALEALRAHLAASHPELDTQDHGHLYEAHRRSHDERGGRRRG